MTLSLSEKDDGGVCLERAGDVRRETGERDEDEGGREEKQEKKGVKKKEG